MRDTKVLNTSPPRDRFTFLRGSCSEIVNGVQVGTVAGVVSYAPPVVIAPDPP